MKLSSTAAGIMGLLLAGSAKASVLYDTITNQPTENSLLILAQQNHAPMGVAFSSPVAQTITSVEVSLIDRAAVTNITDSGSVLVYLVPSVSNLPAATGVALTNPIYLGTILDNTLLGNNVINNKTLSTNVSIAAGNYWLELTSSSDPNNFHDTVNPTPTTAGWEEFQVADAVSPIGLPATNYASYTNPNNTGLVDATNGYVFMAQVQASVPEPAGLVVLGSGLMGLGISRRRRTRKPADFSQGV